VGAQGRQAGKPASGWASPQWRAVQANLTQQLKDADGSFNSYRVTDTASAQAALMLPEQLCCRDWCAVATASQML
jgi:hypothetical protein